MYGLELGIYSDAFDEIVNIVVKRYKAKMQTLIAICGKTGATKSTLGIRLCQAIAKKLKLPFDFEKDMIYSAGNVWNKLDEENFSPICLYDEAALTLNAKRSMSRENIDLENAFTVLRSRGMISIMCMPELEFMDKQIGTFHVEYRINVYDERDPLIKDGGKGFFDFNDQRVSKKSKKIWWNVLFAGVFDDLDDETKSIYEPIKYQKQQEMIKESKRRYESGRQ